jgi:hypothetical protein
MKGRSWIVIGIILFIWMTVNIHVTVVGELGTFFTVEIGEEPTIHQLWEQYLESRNFPGLPYSTQLWIMSISWWTIYVVLEVLSVYMIIKGVKKRRLEN